MRKKNYTVDSSITAKVDVISDQGLGAGANLRLNPT